MNQELRVVFGFVFMVAFAIIFVPIIPTVSYVYQLFLIIFIVLGFVVVFFGSRH